MKSPRELRPRKDLACHKALGARSNLRRLQNLRAQVDHLTPRRRDLRSAKALEEEMNLLQEKPVVAFELELDLSINVSDDSGLEVDVLHPPIDEVGMVADAALDHPTNEVALEPLTIEVMTVADTAPRFFTNEVVTVDPLATEVVTTADTASESPTDEVTTVVDTEVYCHQCEDHTWLDLESHALAFHGEGRGNEDPPAASCPQQCTCNKHRIYLSSYAPKFGDKPISGKIDKVVTGNRIESSDVPGFNFWIETRNKCLVRPDPEDVHSFEQEFLHSDPSFMLEDGIHFPHRDLFGW